MSIRVHQRLPRTPVIGKDQTLSLTVSGGTVVSPKLTVKLGGTTLVDDQDAAGLSYNLLAATTADRDPSDEWLELWSGTVDGEPWSYQLGGYLVRCNYYGKAADSDLQRHHPDILDRLPDGETDTSKFRELATEQIQRDLLKKGRRPWLVFDQWALVDAETYLALHYWAADCARRFPNSNTYRLDADRYERRYREEIQTLTFRYDREEVGQVVHGDEQEAADGPSMVMLTAGRPRYRGGVW